ncbi:hypothetical protein B0H34DRAFT_468877 [Crassisporium funariophilum]|nr:hypothetical protein B0H34DRAFT_468877 [Crassisporium funariophilum]
MAKLYDGSERTGVAFIATAGLVSLLAVLYLVLVKRVSLKTYKNTHMFGYFMSLLGANVLQSIGTVMNYHWVSLDRVKSGSYCSAQGGIKQAGNIGVSFWSLVIAIHLFNLLFLRILSHKAVPVTVICIVWLTILLIVVLGPAVAQTKARGPYFGISGAWCWITSNYPLHQIYLEYFFSFMSAGFSFILYSAVILRVRGNLAKGSDGKWRLQFLPPGQEWQLAVSRDMLDNAMLSFAKKMVWYPIAYTIILIPITITRFIEFGGSKVPFGATAFTAVIFNLMGFINVILVIYIERCFPEPSTLPEFSTKREHFRDSLAKSGGVVPFTVQDSNMQATYLQGRTVRAVVTLPTKPQNTYVPPASWKTTASNSGHGNDDDSEGPHGISQ